MGAVLFLPLSGQWTAAAHIQGPNPYKFIGFGGIHGPKPYKFIWFGDIHSPKPYKFIGSGDIHGPNTYVWPMNGRGPHTRFSVWGEGSLWILGLGARLRRNIDPRRAPGRVLDLKCRSCGHKPFWGVCVSGSRVNPGPGYTFKLGPRYIRVPDTADCLHSNESGVHGYSGAYRAILCRNHIGSAPGWSPNSSWAVVYFDFDVGPKRR